MKLGQMKAYRWLVEANMFTSYYLDHYLGHAKAAWWLAETKHTITMLQSVNKVFPPCVWKYIKLKLI